MSLFDSVEWAANMYERLSELCLTIITGYIYVLRCNFILSIGKDNKDSVFLTKLSETIGWGKLQRNEFRLAESVGYHLVSRCTKRETIIST